MFVKLLTGPPPSPLPSKFILSHKRGDTLKGTCLRHKKGEQHKCSGWYLCPAAARLNLWQNEYSGEDVEYLLCFIFTSFPSKQRGSYMFQRSVIGGLWCAAVVPLSFLSAVSCHPPLPRPKALWQRRTPVRPWSSAWAQLCDSNSITAIPVIINWAAGNIGICSAQTDKASLLVHNIPCRLQRLHRMLELFGSFKAVWEGKTAAVWHYCMGRITVMPRWWHHSLPVWQIIVELHWRDVKNRQTFNFFIFSHTANI